MQLRSNPGTPPTSRGSTEHHEESAMAAAYDSLAQSHHQRLAYHHAAEARAARAAEALLAIQTQADVDFLTNEMLHLSQADMQSLVSRLLAHSRNGNPVADSMLAAVASLVQRLLVTSHTATSTDEAAAHIRSFTGCLQPAIFAPPSVPLRNQQHAFVIVGTRRDVQRAHLQLVQQVNAASGCIISPVAPFRIHAVGIAAAAATRQTPTATSGPRPPTLVPLSEQKQNHTSIFQLDMWLPLLQADVHGNSVPRPPISPVLINQFWLVADAWERKAKAHREAADILSGEMKTLLEVEAKQFEADAVLFQLAADACLDRPLGQYACLTAEFQHLKEEGLLETFAMELQGLREGPPAVLNDRRHAVATSMRFFLQSAMGGVPVLAASLAMFICTEQGALQPGDSVGIPPGAIARAEQLTAGSDPSVLLAQMVAAGQAAYPAAAAQHRRWAAAQQLQLLQPVAAVQQQASAGTDDESRIMLTSPFLLFIYILAFAGTVHVKDDNVHCYADDGNTTTCTGTTCNSVYMNFRKGEPEIKKSCNQKIQNWNNSDRACRIFLCQTLRTFDDAENLGIINGTECVKTTYFAAAVEAGVTVTKGSRHLSMGVSVMKFSMSLNVRRRKNSNRSKTTMESFSTISTECPFPLQINKGQRGFKISETACDGTVCYELQTAANEGLKFCPKRRVGWPSAVNSCRIEMCSFLDHPAARGLRKKGNTYCAVKDAWMLCCCRERLCNSERLSYEEKRSDDGDGEYFDTSKCPPKTKLRNFTLMEELSNEDFHKNINGKMNYSEE
ncbi:hypothetical protein PRIPAC_92676 [Pristionchus pacificus]|uniref:Uncharacterized protein n=1 Tax=Pristionchus pacificus TaxID=54126 RepID=A0A2A6CHX8_PRIPA|nr:hypothetical protein PRIPAC_92676 [Pristionchus pacificus]|eukprot:PDM77834.1 hypothetical protein PRIPAC_34701 [Pristionchus pacificus]